MLIAKCVRRGYNNRLYKQDDNGRDNYFMHTEQAHTGFYAPDDSAAVEHFAKCCGVPVKMVVVIKSPIDIKVDYLKELGILCKNSVKQEEAIRIILATCTSSMQRDIKLHDLIVGNETVAEFIRRHEHILVQKREV